MMGYGRTILLLWYDDRGYKFIFTCLFSCAFKSAPIRIQYEIPIDSPLQLWLGKE